MAVNQNIPILFDEALPPVSGSGIWGFYDNDPEYQTDCVKFTYFAARCLGWPIEDVELDPITVYAAFESAVNTYGKELYEYKIRENYLILEGSPTGSDLNNSVIQPNLGTVIRIAKNYGSEAGTGGNVTYYTGSIKAKYGQQNYDLDMWASSSEAVQPGDSIEVKRVFYEIPPAVNRAFDPTFSTGLAYQDLFNTFGMAAGESFGTAGMNYTMFPAYADVLRVQAIEFNDQIRRSAYSFELVNNKLRIFPVPAFNRTISFHYIKNSERNSPVYTVNGVAPQNLVTNVGNVPYASPVYTYINKPFRKWIMDYGVALCKEILGNVRSKYSVIEIPGDGSSLTLNGPALLAQSDADKAALITQLRDTLDNSSRTKQLAMQAEQAASINAIQSNVPMLIYIF